MDPSIKVPARVRSRVQFALDYLRDTAEECHRMRTAEATRHDSGRYVQDVLRHRHERLTHCRDTLAAFREKCPQNSVDAEACIRHWGGEAALPALDATPSHVPAD